MFTLRNQLLFQYSVIQLITVYLIISIALIDLTTKLDFYLGCMLFGTENVHSMNINFLYRETIYIEEFMNNSFPLMYEKRRSPYL